jgi:hypothetical protein
MKIETNHPTPIPEMTDNGTAQGIERKPYEIPILEQHGEWKSMTGQFGSGVIGGP